MNANIGKIIAEKRKAIGLTQAELADKLFVTNKAVSKWENGHGLPDINIIMSLSKILNIPLNEVFGSGNFEDVKKIITHKKKYALLFYFSVLFFSLGMVTSFIFRNDIVISLIIFAVFSTALICFYILNYTYNIVQFKKKNQGNILLNYFSNVLKQASSILCAIILASIVYVLFLTLFKGDVNNQAFIIIFILILSTVQILSIVFVFLNKQEESRTDEKATEILIESKEINSETDCVLHGYSTNTNGAVTFWAATGVGLGRIALFIRWLVGFIRQKNYVLTFNENQIKLIYLKRFTCKVKDIPPTVFDWSMVQSFEVFKTKFGNNNYAIKIGFSKGGTLQFEYLMRKQKNEFLKFKELYEKIFHRPLNKAKLKALY